MSAAMKSHVRRSYVDAYHLAYSHFRRCFLSTVTKPKAAHDHQLNAKFKLQSPVSSEVDDLVRFFNESRVVTVLTGAGISTSSGIPDYRGPGGSYKLGHKPMTHTEFMTAELSRKRFWARSMVGWLTVSAAEPNDAHVALAKLEKAGRVGGIITQNVDRLHHRAGSHNIIDLHGRVDQVRCQCCKTVISREEWQYALISRNAAFLERTKEQQRQQALQAHAPTTVRADGDAELGLLDYNEMQVPSCQACGGIIKLDVVMFGDNVPSAVVDSAYTEVDNADALLVVGTSLEVFSAYRFVHRANKRQIPIAIVNYGQTRAEREGLQNIRYKSEANCAELLKFVSEKLSII